MIWLCFVLSIVFLSAPAALLAMSSGGPPASGVPSNGCNGVARARSIAACSTAICPFCAAINATFAEQISKHEITVVAKLVFVPPPSEELESEFPKAKFEILQVIKGDEFVAAGMTFQTQLVGTYPLGEKFLVMGVEPPSVFWSTPMQTTDRVVKYLLESQSLPPKGPDRLAFFQEYFEDEESVLAFDAFDEFAVADYDDLIAMKDRIKKDKLVERIHDREIRVDRRRLYFTMLGVCGGQNEIELLERLMKSDDPEDRTGLDALVAAYLTLKGESGVSLVEEVFLKRPDTEDPAVNAVISALRFHGTDVEVIPRARIAQAVRLVLDHPKLADTVIPDLARWEDWSVIDRLVELFKNCDDDYQYIRVPVVAYLHACPKPEAKTYLKELEAIDPDAVRRARFFMGETDFVFDEEDEENEDHADDGGDEESEMDSPIDGVNVDSQRVPTDRSKTSASDEPGAETTIFFVNSRNSDSDLIQTGPASRLAAADLGEMNLVDEGTNRTDSLDAERESTGEVAGSEVGAVMEGTAKKAVNMKTVSGKTETVNSIQNPTDARLVTNAANSPSALENATPVAIVYGPGTTWMIVFVPIGFSLVLFILIWSVVNGWFERLIY